MGKVKNIWMCIWLVATFATPCIAVDYWWVQGNNGVLVHATTDGDVIQIDNRFHSADRRSEIAIHPTNGSCWVTDSFQGKVSRYTPQHETISLSGFGAPVALALDKRSDTLWVADAALHFVMRVSATGQTLQKITVRSPKGLAIGPDGNCWVLTWRGIQPIVNGEVKPPVQKGVKYFANTPDATTLWSADKEGHLYHINSDGVQRLSLTVSDCKGLVATRDGGCWLLTPQQAVRISDKMELIGKVTGFHFPKKLISQPMDGSVWVIDSGYNRAVRLPAGDTSSSDKLVAFVGWKSIVRNGTIKREIASDIHWESVLPPKSDGSPHPDKETKTTPESRPSGKVDRYESS